MLEIKTDILSTNGKYKEWEMEHAIFSELSLQINAFKYVVG